MKAELDRETILAAFARLNELLREGSVMGEICLLGGTVLVLAFDARARTKDVDAIFQPSTEIRAAAARVAEEMDLPVHWLNDGKGVRFRPTRSRGRRSAPVRPPEADRSDAGVFAGHEVPHPWFASPGPAIRATLLLESPAPFRERNLFVSENALARA